MAQISSLDDHVPARRERPARPANRLLWAAPFLLAGGIGAALVGGVPDWLAGSDEAAPAPTLLRGGAAGEPAPPAGPAAVGSMATDAVPQHADPVDAAADADAEALDRIRAILAAVDAKGGPVRIDVPPADGAMPGVDPGVAVVRGRADGPAAAPAETADPGTGAEPVAVAGVHFVLCRLSPHADCVVGGDSFRLNGDTIRIADIDAPEADEPGCLDEAAAATRATYRLQALLNAGGFLLSPAEGPDRDDHGRALRLVSRDGRSLGAMLVAEDLARAWDAPAVAWCR
ncbi:MAG: hypothetical protein R3F55_19465 [Alphaproteobacteria bacterium]